MRFNWTGRLAWIRILELPSFWEHLESATFQQFAQEDDNSVLIQPELLQSVRERCEWEHPWALHVLKTPIGKRCVWLRSEGENKNASNLEIRRQRTTYSRACLQGHRGSTRHWRIQAQWELPRNKPYAPSHRRNQGSCSTWDSSGYQNLQASFYKSTNGHRWQREHCSRDRKVLRYPSPRCQDHSQ